MSIVREKKKKSSLNSYFLQGCVPVYLDIPASTCVGNRNLCFHVDFLSYLM